MLPPQDEPELAWLVTVPEHVWQEFTSKENVERQINDDGRWSYRIGLTGKHTSADPVYLMDSDAWS